MEYLFNVLNQILITIIVAQSFNLVLGYTGMVHVGHVGFMAIGAYASSLLTLGGMPFWPALFLATCIAGAVGLLLGIPTVRFRDDYIVAATLGLGEIIRLILINERQFTGGSSGLTHIMRPELFGFSFEVNHELFFLLLALTVIILLLIRKLVKSPFGRVLESIREDELASKSLGKNTWLVKLQILVIAAAIAGFSGALWAHTTNFIDPETFNINVMILVFLIVVLGGSGNFYGPIVGSFIYFGVIESLRMLPLPANIVGSLRWLIFSTVLIIILIYKPKGIMGEKLIRKKL